MFLTLFLTLTMNSLIWIIWVSIWILCSWINTQIYNLISVPQITRLLVGDTITSSKTNPHNGSKKQKRSYGKIKNNKTMLKILQFTQILYHKQQSSILQCFSRIKFLKSLFWNTFFSFIFRSKIIINTAEKDQIKYFAQN